MQGRNHLKKLVLAALFLALAYVLPFFTGQVPQIGKMLCPMHFPVLLCGFLCGPAWGLAVGFLAPLSRSLFLGMPQLFPSALCMAFELAGYGLVAGLLYRRLPGKRGGVYPALLSAMVAGRLLWGAAMFLCLGVQGTAFPLSAFLAGAVGNALPGIVLQLILIPPLLRGIERLLGQREKAT